MAKRHTRRKALASIGVGLSGIAGLSGVSGGQPGGNRNDGRSQKEIIEDSYRILQKTGEREKRVQYLENHGLETSYEEITVEVSNKSGEVGTQEIRRANIELGMSMTKGWYDDYYTAGVDWRYTDLYEENDSGGYEQKWGMEAPYDILGITWYEDWWDYNTTNQDETMSTSDHVWYRSGTFTGGPAFNIAESADDSAGNGDPSDYCYANVYLDPIGDYEPNERKVDAKYVHNYRRTDIESVGVSWDSITVNLSNNTYQNEFDQDDDGNFLRVYQSDV